MPQKATLECATHFSLLSRTRRTFIDRDHDGQSNVQLLAKIMAVSTDCAEGPIEKDAAMHAIIVDAIGPCWFCAMCQSLMRGAVSAACVFQPAASTGS